jgi:hypothetical protein
VLRVLYEAIAAELLLINAYTVPLIGEEHVRTNDPPPKMIFIPNDDTFGPVEGPGGNPRSFATIMAATELVLQGRTLDIVEGMRDQFVIALHHACKKASAGTSRAGRYSISKGKWTRNAALKAVNGREYRLTFAVAFPVVLRTWEADVEPDASTYDGDKANTYPVIPGDELKIETTVSPIDAPAEDRVTITVPPTP